jgi:hypothetical protein
MGMLTKLSLSRPDQLARPRDEEEPGSAGQAGAAGSVKDGADIVSPG